MIFFISCFIAFSANLVSAGKTETAPEKITNDEDYYSIVGFDLMDNEVLGLLKRGLSQIKVLEMLGEPEKKSKLKLMGYDGEKHQKWFFKQKGIELDMMGAKNKQQIEMIKISAPCNFRTKSNIGVGSSKEEVLAAYKKEISLSPTNPDTNSDKDVIIAGTIYGGIFFYIKNNRVSSIFIGSGAE
jgi:hypothetical protein